MHLRDKVVVVTGAGNGVGRMLTIQLLQKGARVACVDIQPESLNETMRLADEYAERAASFEADITDHTIISTLPQKIIDRFGAVDVLINNAGIIHPFLRLEEIAPQTIEKVMRVNFYGAVTVTKAFLPFLRARPNAYIVNLSSAGALCPMPGETVYGASKSAVRMLTEGLRYELRSTGIRVMAVFPGGINTNIIQNSGVVVGSSIDRLRARLAFLLLTPQKAAKKIITGLERNRSRLVLGIDANAMDVLCRVCPGLAPGLLYRVIDAILSPHVRSGQEPEAGQP